MVPKQVYWYDQARSRANTEPKVPLDPTKPKRMFLILASRFGNSITCAPLNSNSKKAVGFTEAELLSENYKWLQNDTLVLLHSITTLNTDCFEKTPAGVISDSDFEKVKTAIKNHLRIK